MSHCARYYVQLILMSTLFVCFYPVAACAIEILGVNIPNEIVLAKSEKKLILNGYAVRTLTGQKSYVAALYLPNIEKRPEMILLNDDPSSMQLFFLQDDFDPEEFLNLLTEAVILNTPDEKKRKAEEEKLIALKAAFKQSINAGDVLVLDYSPSFGLRVSLNKKQLIAWPQAKLFYNMILKTWIGSRPPSTAFKQAILNFPAI